MGVCSDYLKLVCGDPRNDPASFSRFVFPFAYDPKSWSSPVEIQDGCAKLHYKESFPDINADDLFLQARKDYFTWETKTVLFESARWLEMDPDAWSQTTWAHSVGILSRKKKVQVSMLPPRLVLFEWPFGIDNVDSRKGRSETFQTGFLFLDLYFPDLPYRKIPRPEIDDLLVINTLFRYFRYSYEKLDGEYRDALTCAPLSYETKDTVEHDRTIGSEGIGNEEAYLYRWTRLLAFPVNIGNKRWRLVPSSFDNNSSAGPTKEDQETNLPYTDHRAYVWSAAILKNGAESLSKHLRTSQWRAHEFGHWIRLLNVDSPDTSGSPTKTHKNVMKFERKWARDRTYHRWEELGTWYGFNYHSGVMLGPPSNSPEDTPIWRHFRHMYFDIALLLLYIRVSLFRFSRQLTKITSQYDMNDPESHKAFQRLRSDFTTFTIRYQFPLLSNQQQAIEMYALARQHFDIDDLYREIKQEIDNTHEFIETIRQRDLSETANKIAMDANEASTTATIITRWGIPIAIGALFASIFGMNAKDFYLLDWIRIATVSEKWWKNISWRSTSVSFIVLVSIVIIASIIGWLIVNDSKNPKNET